MIKVENVKVYNIGRAVYSTRNSYDSWDKSDSDIENDILGPSDLELATKLAKAGSPHNKFMRQIFVTMDVTCSLDFWKQADTYLIGTTKNSCSTMHRIQSKKFSIDDFNTDEMSPIGKQMIQSTVIFLNSARDAYLKTHDKAYWYDMVRILPESYMQRRTWTMNYAVLAEIVKQRTGHKLKDWDRFIVEIMKLPYAENFLKR